MALQIDHGRRVQLLDGRAYLTHELSTRAGDMRPAAGGYVLVRVYASRAAGLLAFWRRSFPVRAAARSARRDVR